jgi:hypothetical protein
MSSETLRATQEMRGRPVTYAEACRAADRLIARAHNGTGEKSTMSIPVQASDDDVLLTDYLTEQARLVARYAEARDMVSELVSLLGTCVPCDDDHETMANALGLAESIGAALSQAANPEVK